MADEQQPGASAGDDDDAVSDDTRPADDVIADEDDDDDDAAIAETRSHAKSGSGIFSSFGLVSAFLGLLCVAAVVVGLVMWSTHRSAVEERGYKSRVLQTAASWTSGLINLNAENVEKGMERLRDKTVGELNGEFDAAVGPYRDVVQRIQSRSSGRIEAVAIETMHHDPDNPAADHEKQNSDAPGRTESVMVIATSMAENVGGKPQIVHWALHLDVTDVDGRMLISRLRSIR